MLVSVIPYHVAVCAAPAVCVYGAMRLSQVEERASDRQMALKKCTLDFISLMDL